jgi:glycosyltransferase involved in cell wall biosynthesis
MNACTIIAANYLAHARVLAESFFEHHPDGTFTVLSLDDLTDLLEERDRFRVMRPNEIGIEPDELQRMALLYDVRELSTAVKPFLLRTLLAHDDHAAYLDPDIRVYRSLEFIADLSREHGLVLTPHNNRPFPRDGRTPGEQDIMIAGIYNLGFCCVGERSVDFLDWWSERLARDCIADPEHGLFVDQKWVDWAPGMFDHVISHDTTINIAYWNCFSRELMTDGDSYMVDGEPLGFFHFSGFDPTKPQQLSKHQNRVDVNDNPALAKICREYADAMLDAGFLAVRGLPCEFDSLPDGSRLDDAMRRSYRAALLRAERSGGPVPPVPGDDAQTEEFLAWLQEPIARRGPGKHVSRYLMALREGRADLNQAFPDMGRRADVDEYLTWLQVAGAAELDVHPRLRPAGSAEPATEQAADPADPPVTVAGYFKAELGVGEAGRSIVAGLKSADIPYVTRTVTETLSRQQHPFEDSGLVNTENSDLNIVCVNADALPGFASEAGHAFFRDRYTVGLWFWEVSEFPRSMHDAFGFVDEVWVSSEFVRAAIQPETIKPVRVVPMSVAPPPVGALNRSELGIRDGFMFLFVFDLMSIIERKNPFAVIEAYRSAFSPQDGATLVIKTINGEHKPAELQRLRDAVDGHEDITLVDGYLPLEQKNGLMSQCDCYVSLHRSEGLGLTMAEAMALGKPVIATGYSGNLAFMDAQNSMLVDYEIVSVPDGCAPYPTSACWAEPDVAHAARLMRQAFDDPAGAQELGERARKDVLTRMSPERTGEFISDRINWIREHAMSMKRTPLSMRGPVSRAESFVRTGPENSWDNASGRGGRFFRNFLQRLLKPYTIRQREFETAVVEALQDSLHAEVDLRAQLDGIETKLDALLARVPEPVQHGHEHANA